MEWGWGKQLKKINILKGPYNESIKIHYSGAELSEAVFAPYPNQKGILSTLIYFPPPPSFTDLFY